MLAKSMKGKQMAVAALTVMALNTLAPLTTQAESLDQLNQQEQQLTKESESISAEVQLALNDVNKTYQKVDALKAKIATNQATLKKTNEDMIVKEATVQKRKKVMADRLRSIQMNEASEGKLEMLLNADSIKDFVNNVYAITVMQQSEKATVDSLNAAVQELQTLKTKEETTQKELATNQAALEDQAQALDTKVKGLQKELTDKQGTLQKIANDKINEEARIKAEAERTAREKAAQEAAAKAEAKAQAQAEATTQAQEQAKSEAAQPAANLAQPVSSQSAASPVATTSSSSTSNAPATTPAGGKVLYMESTAYSYAETGYSITASGLDLRKNPMAIAVDPRVIPLGTLVNVEGYGVAIAADTGGAIKGNIIDVHFSTVEQCRQWGRRHNVKVTVLG